MATIRAQLVAASGASFDADVHNLTSRSAFLAGPIDVGFGHEVRLTVLGHTVDARVAFVSAAPSGVVVTFEAQQPLVEAIAERREVDTDWDDEETRSHDARHARALAAMVARAEGAASLAGTDEPEDPTNRGSRSLEVPEDEVTPPAVPAVYTDGRVVAVEESTLQDGLLQPASAPDASVRGPKLRATTQVSHPAPGDDD